jgi:hypothetical protein
MLGFVNLAYFVARVGLQKIACFMAFTRLLSNLRILFIRICQNLLVLQWRGMALKTTAMTTAACICAPAPGMKSNARRSG